MTVGELFEPEALPPTVSVEEAGELLGISRRSAYRAAERGELPVVRVGRRILVPSAKLLALLGVRIGSDDRGAEPEPARHTDRGSSASRG